MPPQVDLSVIIVNYNTATFLTACLRSALNQHNATFEIWVVNNASADHSVGMVGTRLLYPVHTLQGSVEESYPGQRHAAGELTGLPGQTAWLLKESLIIRREVMEQVGGFREDFFLYGEDIDLGFKVRQAGWELGFIPGTEGLHWGGKNERHTLPIEVVQKKLAAAALFYRRYCTPTTAAAPIYRANIHQARWRLLTLSIKQFLTTDKAAVTAKLNCYRLLLDFFPGLAAKASSP